MRDELTVFPRAERLPQIRDVSPTWRITYLATKPQYAAGFDITMCTGQISGMRQMQSTVVLSFYSYMIFWGDFYL